jgi:hypothetical protein
MKTFELGIWLRVHVERARYHTDLANIRDDYRLRSRQQWLRDAGMLTLIQIATLLGVSTGTIKIWHHAGFLTRTPLQRQRPDQW